MNNNLHQIPKTTPSKQGKDTLKLLLGTNTQLKEDGSTKPTLKIPLKPPKNTEKRTTNYHLHQTKNSSINARESHTQTHISHQ